MTEMSMVKSLERLEQRLAVMVAAQETSQAWSSLGEEGPATMKNDKSRDRDEADCRAELILISGDCTSPTKDTPALVLEPNGKPSAPGAGGLGLPSLKNNKRVNKGDLSKEDLSWPLALAGEQEVRPRGSAGWESSLRQKPPVRLIFQAGQTRHEMKIKETNSVETLKDLPTPLRVRVCVGPGLPWDFPGALETCTSAVPWPKWLQACCSLPVPQFPL
ncbi:dna (cytosine-5)-methyltransferase 3b [Limosa lapponica baueri]|uniref:Dna (Cytosine-5)-methyltransferase 3b n=1 Tax=Limosa lapponica baueri TaxID=1758121 RepID=A0A2I0T539_LIMLA|nr:dna (cytosine-5)-methyltransferase 3b [Limosa lapponica baueri]